MLHIKKALFILFSILIISSCFTFSVSAQEESLKDIYNDPYGRTMIAARKGLWKEAPENSLSAIKAAEAADADIIEIDVRTTADGVLILMADETVDRTCYGYGENTVVEEMTFDEIKKLYLLNGEGGHGAIKTAEKVPTLEEVFKQRTISISSSSALNTPDYPLFMIDADWTLRDEICNLAIEHNMLGDIIFYIDDAKPDEIATWEASLPAEPMVIAYFKGNVIFAATSAVKKASEIADSIHLATKNPYGVIFGKTVQNTANESGIRTMATPCLPELCGTIMQDTQVWWDELISRGYSIILTDYPSELKDYLDDCEDKFETLEETYRKTVTDWQLPDFNSDKFYDYKLSYTNAKELTESLLKDKSNARSTIVTATYDLQKAYNDINNNYDELAQGTAGMTVTPVRILLCIAAVAVVVIAEIYIYKQKKK